MQLLDEINGLVEFVDPFEDEEPIIASCDLDNPSSCESCQ